MKKQIKALALIPLIFLTGFVGCTFDKPAIDGKVVEENKTLNPQPTPAPTKTPYKDGTFTGKSPITKDGQEEAVVIIKDGKISAVTLKVLDTSGKEINYSMYTGQSIDNKFYPDINSYRMSFAKSIIENQTTNVPEIKEIPEISQNWKVAVDNALTLSKDSKNK